jgi:chorismate synthase
VAAGAIAQKILFRQAGIEIIAWVDSVGSIGSEAVDMNSITQNQVDTNDIRCPDIDAAKKMTELVSKLQEQKDSVGGVVKCVCRNVPPGLGEPVFDKLDADIAKALMSVGSVKAVEIGAGIEASQMTGFENNDQILSTGFATNNSGGILAGISNGDDIIARVHIKPIPSISRGQITIDEHGQETEISIGGRHDICAIPRINMVCEAMMAITITDHLLRQNR